MIISISMGGRTFEIDDEKPIDISIPLKFNGPQPNAYGVERAVSHACEAGDIVGDTRRGGSCNFEQYTFIPHCNGTHTECVGHITNERISVRDCLQDVFMMATLVSVEPVWKNDPLITREILKNALGVGSVTFNHPLPQVVLTPNTATISTIAPTALIVRTLPNDNSKLTREYLEDIPPFFTQEAMEHIVGLGVGHLLVDMPSIDRIYDEGKLLNHRIFWNVEPGGFEINENTRVNNTVTELIYVPNEVEDGEFLLNLQIAPFETDAAPSRPVMFKIENQ